MKIKKQLEHAIAGFESPMRVKNKQIFGKKYYPKEKQKMGYIRDKVREDNFDLYEDFLEQLYEDEDCPTCDEKIAEFLTDDDDLDDEMYDDDDSRLAGIGDYEETDDLVTEEEDPENYMYDEEDDSEVAGEGDDNEYDGPDDGQEMSEGIEYFFEEEDPEDEMYDDEDDSQLAGVHSTDGDYEQDDEIDNVREDIDFLEENGYLEDDEDFFLNNYLNEDESDELRNKMGRIPISHPEDPDIETTTGGVWDYLTQNYVEDFLQGPPRTGNYHEELYVPRQLRKTYRRHNRTEIPG